MPEFPKIILKQGREKSILKKHLWVFSGAVFAATKELVDGEIVEIYSANKEYLATGHYQNSSICVRIFSFEKIETNIINLFWEKRIKDAVQKRVFLGFFDDNATNSFRLIHGESDLMPGLIADYYNGIIVLQAHSVGMYDLLPFFSSIFQKILADNITAIYSKSGNTVKQAEKELEKNMFLFGKESESIFSENNMLFFTDFINGQKTGFFLDQRDNRAILAKYCKNKNVLNMFCYTGAFTITALKNGASNVVSVDCSEHAIEATNKNVFLNFGKIDNHISCCADAFEYFDKQEDKYDIIILDPPAFAKHLDAKQNAMKAYRRLNATAIKALKKNGLLFTFSCSQVIDKTDFLTAIYNAARDVNSQISIIHQLHQSSDHPINIFHPETEYLKGLVLMLS